MTKKAVNTEHPDPEIILCGHINRHSLGVDGEPDGMTCFLPKGHELNEETKLHRGRHMTRYVRHIKEGKRIVGETYEDRETESEWSDGASIPIGPVAEIKPKTLAEQEFGINAEIVMKGS